MQDAHIQANHPPSAEDIPAATVAWHASAAGRETADPHFRWAGFGKTTLIANAIRQEKCQAVWYTLDEIDRDFPTFIAYLHRGGKPYLPGVDDILAGFQSAARLSARQRLEILEKLIHQLEKTIDFELILVLDDFHLIQDKPEICESIEFLLKHIAGRPPGKGT